METSDGKSSREHILVAPAEPSEGRESWETQTNLGQEKEVETDRLRTKARATDRGRCRIHSATQSYHHRKHSTQSPPVATQDQPASRQIPCRLSAQHPSRGCE